MSNYRLALDKLKKFNNFVLKDKELNRFFLSGDYNFLQAYQSPMFFDMLSFIEGKDKSNNKSKESSKISFLLIRLRQIMAFFVSFLSYLFLVISRVKILVYTADKDTAPKYQCDFRMFNLFQYLFENNKKFFEIFHTVFKDGFTHLVFKRHRPSIYLEVIDVVYKFAIILGFVKLSSKSKICYDSVFWKDFGDDEALFRKIVSKYSDLMPRSLFRIGFIKRFLKYTNIKLLIATADTRNNNELVVACNNLGIDTYGFQGGNISKYNVGYLDCCGKGKIIKPNKMIVESSYWKNELLRLGTYFREEEIEIGGNLKEDYKDILNVPFYKPKDDKSKIIVLFPYETAAPKEEILSYIKKFLTHPEIIVIFKFRADKSIEEQAKEYGLNDIPDNLRLVTDLKDAGDFDVVAGTYSTFLYEMIGKLKPVLILKTSLDYGEGMIVNNLAQEISFGDNLVEKLKMVKKTDIKILLDRKKRLYGDVIPLKQTLEKILRKMFQLI